MVRHQCNESYGAFLDIQSWVKRPGVDFDDYTEDGSMQEVKDAIELFSEIH